MYESKEKKPLIQARRIISCKGQSKIGRKKDFTITRSSGIFVGVFKYVSALDLAMGSNQ